MPLSLTLAGLFLVLLQGPGLIKALMTGVLVRKGHGAIRIDRRTEPKRFGELVRQRAATMLPGVLMILAGLALMFFRIDTRIYVP